jgi:hypothetical protein
MSVAEGMLEQRLYCARDPLRLPPRLRSGLRQNRAGSRPVGKRRGFGMTRCDFPTRTEATFRSECCRFVVNQALRGRGPLRLRSGQVRAT